MSITNNAVLVRLSIQTFRQSVTDAAVTDEVTSAKGASGDAGRFVKTLFTPTATKPFSEIKSAAQKLVRDYCKPWDLGVYILAMSRFARFEQDTNRLIAEFDAARERLIDNLPEHIDAARRTLGDLFDPTAYPSGDILRRQCVMTVKFLPVPSDKHDIRIGDARAAQAMKDAIIEAHNSFAEATAKGLQDALANVVRRLDEINEASSAGTRSRFSASLIENIRKAVDDAREYNFKGDPAIDMAVNHMRDNLLFHLDSIPLDLPPDDPARVQAVAAALEAARTTQIDLGGLL